MAIKYTTIFLVFVGTVLMLLSILQYHKLIKKCLDENYDKHKSMKKVIHISCISMMYMFLVGYILVFAVLFLTEFINFYFLVGFIFFFGAIFVATMTLTLRFMNSNLSAKNEEILEIFAKSIEMKDLYTKGHSAHVQQIVGLFYEELPSKYRNAISKRKLMDAALLHDPERDRPTVAIYDIQFAEWDDPVVNRSKFDTPKPVKPVLSHEAGNYVTFSRPDLADLFRHNIKPFWMSTSQAKLEELGLLEEATRWAEKSERLYAYLHKCNLEWLRKNPYLSGYHWWLFQDYWTSANGIVDHYFRPKSITAEEVRAG